MSPRELVFSSVGISTYPYNTFNLRALVLIHPSILLPHRGDEANRGATVVAFACVL